MVLICGYGAIEATNLPHNGAIEYVIKPTQRDIKMLKRTKMLKKCSEICITSEYAVLIPTEYASKLSICENVSVLIQHLQGAVILHSAQAKTSVDVPTATINTQKKQRRQVIRKTAKSAQVVEDTPNTGITATGTVVNTLQNSTQEPLHERIKQLETDNARLLAEAQALNTDIGNLQNENAQLNANVQQLEFELQTSNENTDVLENEVTELQQTVLQKNSAYEDLALQLKNVTDELTLYKQNTDVATLQEQVDTLTYTIDVLKGESDENKSRADELTATLETERRQFEADKEQYANIIEQYESERTASTLSEIINKYNSPTGTCVPIETTPVIETSDVQVVCFANDTSGVYDNIRSTITDGNLNAVVLDFSGNRSLSARLKLPATKGVLSLVNGASVSDLVVSRGKTQIIASEHMYDVQLLSVNWQDVITRVKAYANGKPIYILLGCVSSFAVQYTAMLLAQTRPAYLIGKADPDSLLNLYWQLSTLPVQRLKLVLTEYVPGTLKSLLDTIVARYNTTFVNKGAPLRLEKLT